MLNQITEVFTSKGGLTNVYVVLLKEGSTNFIRKSGNVWRVRITSTPNDGYSVATGTTFANGKTWIPITITK